MPVKLRLKKLIENKLESITLTNLVLQVRLKKLKLKRNLRRSMRLIKFYLTQRKELSMIILVMLLLNREVALAALKPMVSMVVKITKILTLVTSTLTSMILVVEMKRI